MYTLIPFQKFQNGSLENGRSADGTAAMRGK